MAIKADLVLCLFSHTPPHDLICGHTLQPGMGGGGGGCPRAAEVNNGQRYRADFKDVWDDEAMQMLQLVAFAAAQVLEGCALKD